MPLRFGAAYGSPGGNRTAQPSLHAVSYPQPWRFDNGNRD
jgi:hypothetical protein